MIKSLRRVDRQARSLNFYDEIFITNEKNLSAEFYEKHGSNIVVGGRGYGYWAWKPYLIKDIMESMQYGDVLQYMDAGCHLNSCGLERLSAYFDITKQSSTGIVAFQAKNSDRLDLPPIEGKNKNFFDQQEYKYNKSDLLIECDVLNDIGITETPQIGATVIFIMKSIISIDLVNEWIGLIEKDFKFIDNTPSSNLERNGFIEHRHDQAIFSVLCKKRGVETISALEYYYPKQNSIYPDWKRLKNYPIHAKRDKDLGLVRNIHRFASRVKKKFIQIICTK